MKVKCLGCGKLIAPNIAGLCVRCQPSAGGSYVNNGKGRGTRMKWGQRIDHVVACSGTIECGPGHPEPPKSEPVWLEGALEKLRRLKLTAGGGGPSTTS